MSMIPADHRLLVALPAFPDRQHFRPSSLNVFQCCIAIRHWDFTFAPGSYRIHLAAPLLVGCLVCRGPCLPCGPRGSAGCTVPGRPPVVYNDEWAKGETEPLQRG